MISRKGNRAKRVFDRHARRKFIKYIAAGWSEEYARKRCCISSTHYQSYKKETEEWIKEVDAARERGVLALEDEAHRRAVKGVLDPVVSAGRIITHRRVYSDSLMSLNLKARSTKFAAASASGTNLEFALAGAAQVLFDRLAALVAHADQAERDLLTEPGKGRPKADRSS